MPSLSHEDYRGMVASQLPEIEGVSDLVEIGRGGFGVVYRGIESEFGREVAVKVLMPSIDERTRKRFERERRAMGAVSNHANIVTVYRGGVAPSGQPYLVMEYLPGGSLDDRLANVGPLDWRAAATIGGKLADALAVAHRAGILHRDVKPGNVFQTEAGEPKLGDFGIARLDDGQDSRTGSITASIAHAPPEIVDGERGDERSDLYSLASTIYALTMGTAPFSRDGNTGLASLLSRIATQDPPGLHLETAAGEFERSLTQALSKRPEDRQDTIQEFGNQLRRAALAPVTQRTDRAQPAAAQPVAAQPEAAQPVAAQPEAAQPVAAQPEAAQPAAAQPEAAQPEAAQPAAAQPVAAQPEAAQPVFADPVFGETTPTRSTSSGQLALLAALALLIAGFGGWAVARAAFGSNDEGIQTETVAETTPTQPTAAAVPTTAAPTAGPARPTPVVAPDPTVTPPPTAAAVPTVTPTATTTDPDALPEGFVTVTDSTRSISMAVPREWATEINDLGDLRADGGFDVGLSAGASFLDLSGDPESRDLTKTGISVFVSQLGDGPIDIDGILDIAIEPFSDCVLGDRSELPHPQGPARYQILFCADGDDIAGVVVFVLNFDEEPGTVAPIVIQIADNSEIDGLDVILFVEVDLAAVPDN